VLDKLTNRWIYRIFRWRSRCYSKHNDRTLTTATKTHSYRFI